MKKTKARATRELMAQQRRRNAAVLKILAPILVVVFTLNTTINILSAAEKHGAEAAPWFIAMTTFQGVVNLILTAIAFFLPRLHRQQASRSFFLLGFVLLFSQAVMLHFSAGHPSVIIIVELAGMGMMYQMRLVPGILYYVFLYITAAAGALTGSHAPVPFFPTTVGAPVLALMMLFIQNRITKQTLKIREQNGALARGNNENLKSLREARALKGEQDKILETVREGLFLIDGDLRVGTQYSAALKDILGRDDIAGIAVVELFGEGFPPDVGRDLDKYLKLMFRPHLRESTLEQLNPLAEVRVLPPSSDSSSEHSSPEQEKHLIFRFSRVLADKTITGLMVTVQDVTARKLLEETVARREEEASAQMELLFSLVHVEPIMLHQFLEEVKVELERIDGLMQANGDMVERLAEMFRRMHSIKGNASVLNLGIFAERGHEFESLINEINEKEAPAHGDLSVPRSKLRDFMKLVEEVEELIARLIKFQTEFEGEDRDIRRLIPRSLEQMIDRISRDLGKTVAFKDADFDPSLIPKSRVTLVREALVQMTRNSMVHGMEAPDERKARGKTAEGSINLRTELENGTLSIIYRDDGRGLQLDKIKSRAAAVGSWSAEELDAMSREQLAGLIFEPGFSTAEKADLNAGRGVGLDLVKTSLQKNGGSVTAAMSPGKFCEFRISLPVE